MSYESSKGNITIAVAGDAMITRRMSPFKENQFLELVNLIRNADASVVNIEMLFHDFEMSWNMKDTVSFQVSEPRNLEELKWMGFDAVTTANNHSYDYSEAGFMKTLEFCDKFKISHAGGGRNLDEARAPSYLDTPGGRVAIMGATTTFSDESRAGRGRPDFPGKPGLNALRHDVIHHVPESVFQVLERAKHELGYQEEEDNKIRFTPFLGEKYSGHDRTKFLNGKFLKAQNFSVETLCNEEDLQGIAHWIRGAGKAADFLIYGTHCHESGPEGEYHGGSRLSPPAFLREFAHFAIDQGCHMFLAHGPHFLRGIEIYKNRPIFYSLGNFIFQNETVRRVPDPAYRGMGLSYDHTPGDWGLERSLGETVGFAADPVFYRSAVPVCRYENGELKEVLIYPIELGFGQPMSQRGRPVLADSRVAQDVLKWLQRLSKPYGTNIEIKGDLGIIKV
jgi:poly-gamma-glutamate synthesis protein (capsule biosynthesis protein)